MRTALLGWMMAAWFGLAALAAREARADDCGSVKGMPAFDGTPCWTNEGGGCDLGIIDAVIELNGVCIGGCCVKDPTLSGSSGNSGAGAAYGGMTSSGAGAEGGGGSTGARGDQFRGGACGVAHGESGAIGVLALTALLLSLTWRRGRSTGSMEAHREQASCARRRSRRSWCSSPRSPNKS